MKKIKFIIRKIKKNIFIFLNNSRKPEFVFRQQALFYEALTTIEDNVIIDKLKVDHKSSLCYYKDKTFELKFPLRYLKIINEIEVKRDILFSFKGLYTESRIWVQKFDLPNSNIIFTNEGRIIDKFYIDVEYFKLMKSSFFVLCPKGDYNWSYRFFEAIMCKAIPIIETNAIDKTMEGFRFYHKDQSIDTYIYSEEIVEFNYNRFLKLHTFLPFFYDI